MKILHVDWQPEGYGKGTILSDLLKEQNRPGGDLRADAVFFRGGEGLERFRGPAWDVLSLGRSTAKDPRGLTALHRLMKGRNAAFLHTWSPWALLAAATARTPVIFVFHGATGMRGDAADFLKRIYYRHVLMKYCRAVTFASKSSLDIFQSAIGALPPGKVRLFPYGRDLAAVHPFRGREETRKKLGVEGKFLIGTAARIAPEKGLDRLVAAVGAVPGRNGCRLLIVGAGSGASEGELKALVRERGMERIVIMPGYRKDALDIVGALDLFVLPSRRETFGLALLEAMALGIPSAVFADGRGAVELLGDAGFVASSPEQLAELICRLQADASLRSDLGRRSVERSKEFDISRMAAKLKGIIPPS